MKQAGTWKELEKAILKRIKEMNDKIGTGEAKGAEWYYRGKQGAFDELFDDMIHLQGISRNTCHVCKTTYFVKFYSVRKKDGSLVFKCPGLFLCPECLALLEVKHPDLAYEEAK